MRRSEGRRNAAFMRQRRILSCTPPKWVAYRVSPDHRPDFPCLSGRIGDRRIEQRQIARKAGAPVSKPAYLGSAPANHTKGDLLVIRANFSIKRSDFGIMPGQMEEKVSDTIELTLSIAGASPK